MRFSRRALMHKMNCKAFPLPRQSRSDCPSCQTFCKHCQTCQRGPPRAKTAAPKRPIQSQPPHQHINVVPVSVSAFEITTCSLDHTADSKHTHSVTENRPDIWKEAGKTGTKNEWPSRPIRSHTGSSYTDIQLHQTEKGDHWIFAKHNNP